MQLPSGQSHLLKILLLILFVSSVTSQGGPQFANLTNYLSNSTINITEIDHILANLTSNFTTGNISEIAALLANYTGPTSANLTELANILNILGASFTGNLTDFQAALTNITMNMAGPPPGNTTNSTAPGNTTNGTAPGNTTNGTAPGNTTNGTAPGNTTNGTAPGNTTNSTAPGNTTNSTAPGNTTNSTAPPVNITYATPPPINSTSAGSFAAPAGTTTFTSKRLQYLQLTVTAANATVNASTLFKVSFYNSGASGSFNLYNITLPGTWEYKTGTKDTLSCSLIKQTVSGNYSLLRFNSASGILENLATNPLGSATSQLNASRISVKENCGAAYFDRNLVLLNSANITSITLPTGWTPSYAADSIAFGVANNILYRFNPTTSSYSQIYTFTSSSQAYSIQSQPGKVIVAASSKTNPTANSTTPSNVRQTFYIFSDNTAGFTLLNQFEINGVLPAPGNATATFAPSGSNPDDLKITIPFVLSPTFSKLLIIYKPLNSTTRATIIKNIDYSRSTVSDVTFKEQSRYAQTNALLSDQNGDFAIGQNYFVVRNQSTYNAGVPANPALEQAYQFVANQLVFLRSKPLTTTDDLTRFVKVFIDPAYTTQLVVINVYVNAGTYSVASNAFGSLASVNKILPPTVPAYISFYKPVASVTPTVIPGALGWAYQDYDGSNATTSTYYRFTPNATNNVQSATTAVIGSWSMIAISENCHVEKKATANTYNLVSRLPASGTNSTLVINPIDITTLLTGLTGVDAATWYFSPRCDRFAVLGKIFFKAANGTFTLFQTLAFNSVDKDISSAIVGSNAYALDPVTSSAFIPVYAYNGTIATTNQNLYRGSYYVVITTISTNTAQVIVFVFSLTSSDVTKVLDYSFTFTAVPKIRVSNGYSKILVIGAYNGSVKADGFFIDFANKQYINITYPITAIRDIVNSYFLLTEQYLYIRGTTWDATTPPADIVFYLDKDITPLRAAFINLTAADQVTNFVKTVFLPDPNGNNFFLIETVGGNSSNPQIVVKTLQVSAQQAQLNANSNNPGSGVTGVMTSTGAIKLCPPGCSDCSTGTCTGCGGGWAFDSSSGGCNLCGVNCLACSSPNYQQCTSCIPGTYLTNSTCQPCTAPCITCSTSATTCTSCPPGLNLGGGACSACPRNCLVCANGTSCTTCNNGFIVTATGTCRGCSGRCSSCNAANITECTACANGLYLSSGRCLACPARCLTCTSGSVCSNCVSGYTPNSAGTCVLSCQLPCATCVAGAPSYCLSCYSSGILSNGVCTFDNSCNSDNSCTDCGQGFGLILVGSNCYACTSIDNCLQCSTSDTEACTICKSGYFVDSDSTCTACDSTCSKCISSTLCTTCNDGYTLASSVTQGQCLTCTAPCATCQGSATFCLTCVGGYTKQTSKCRPNIYVGFKIVLGGTPAAVLAAIDTLIAAFLTALNESSTNTDVVTIETITLASTNVDGSVAPTNGNTATASTGLATAVSSGTTFGSFPVVSSSVTIQGTSSSSSQDKTALIVGLAVGIPIAVIIIILVSVVIYKKKKAEHHQVNDSDQLEVKVVMKEQPEEMNNSLNSLGEKKNSKGKLPSLGVSDN